jgi:hypothetical protein
MPIEDLYALAAELSEFGYSETDNADEADRRSYYKVERWDSTEQHVFQLLHASNDLGRAQSHLCERDEAPTARSLPSPPRDPGSEALAAGSRLKNRAPSTRC